MESEGKVAKEAYSRLKLISTDPRNLLAKGHVNDSGPPDPGVHDNPPRVIRDSFADDLGLLAVGIFSHPLQDP